MRSEAIPPVGTHVRVLGAIGASRSAEVVGHLSDPVLGDVLQLLLSDPVRLFQRVWPSPTIELPPAA